jgi:predicted dehydrogenase
VVRLRILSHQVFNVLFEPIVTKCKRIIRDGEIGEILNILVIRTSPFEEDRYIKNENYWGHSILGGRVCEALPHQIYLLQDFLASLKIENVFAKKLTNYPWISCDEVNVTFSSYPSYGSIYWSRNSAKKEFLVYIIGTKGTLLFDYFTGKLVLIRKLTSSFRSLKYLYKELKQLSTSYLSYNLGKFLYRHGIKNLYKPGHQICFEKYVDSLIKNKSFYVDSKKAYNCVKITEEICKIIDNKGKE